MSGAGQYVATHRKAIAGGVLAAGAALAGYYWGVDSEVVAVLAAVAGTLGVGAVPNRKAVK